MKDDINMPNHILTELRDIAKEFQLDRLILFGSRARRTNHERSDIDLAAYFPDRVSHLMFCERVEKIKTLLMFDVVNLSSEMISVELRISIEREGITIYEKV